MNIAAVSRRIGMIRKLEDENKIRKDTLKQALEGDEAYQTATKDAKEAASRKKIARDQIWSQSENRSILEDIKVDTEEIKTLKEILDHELFEYFRLNGINEIADDSGDLVKFKLIAKLFPKGFTDRP